MTAGGEFTTIARVVKPQGRAGEVVVELFTDFPERFAERRRLFALGTDDRRRELELEGFWPHKRRMILKFAGIDTIDAAEELRGTEIQIPQAERTELESGSFYVSDLTGCQVFAADGESWRELGRVTDVIFGAGEAPLIEISAPTDAEVASVGGPGREGQKEYLIPFVESYTRKVDVAAKRIEMVLPEGMLELDAPLRRKRG